MGFNWGYVAIMVTICIYVIAALIQFRRAYLMRSRVKHMRTKGNRVVAKILSYARPKYVGIEFTNHSGAKVLSGFRINNIKNKLPLGSETYVYMSDNPNNSPAIVLEYDGKIVASFLKYTIFGAILLIISGLLGVVLILTQEEVISNYVGILIPVIAAIVIFIAVTEDEMADNRKNNVLLLCGINVTAHIRKASSTGIVKNGYKQMSFFVEFIDRDGKARFGKAEEPLSNSDYQFLKTEKKVDILYSPDMPKERCLLNYVSK